MLKHVKPSRHRLFAKNLILMLVMLVVIVLSILAWFSVNKTVDASDICVKASTSDIDIANCIKTYDSNYDLLTDGPGEFGRIVSFDGFNLTKDCTGDGVDLIVPEFNVTNDKSTTVHLGKEVNVNLPGAPAISNAYSDLQKLKYPDKDAPEYQYIQMEFYARSKNPELTLTNDCQLISQTEKDHHSLFNTYSYTKSGVTVDKKATYGEFNVDSLVGAIRVALIGEPCTDITQTLVSSGGGYEFGTTGNNAPTSTREAAVKQFLWVPRPDVLLVDNATLSDWYINHVTSSSDTNAAETYKHSYYQNVSGGVSLVSPDTSVTTKISAATKTISGNSIPVLGQSVNISNFSNSSREPISLYIDKSSNAASNKDDYYVTKYTLKVWIEGTDREARRTMDGGEFHLALELM